MVAFVRNCLVKMTEAVLVNFCCYDYDANAYEAVQKISSGTLELYQLLKQLLLQLQLCKNIFRSLLPAYWRYKPGFCFFFSDINKMSNLLHVGLMLIISKALTIFCLLCLCRNREYPCNFQNKTVISKLFFQTSAQVK